MHCGVHACVIGSSLEQCHMGNRDDTEDLMRCIDESEMRPIRRKQAFKTCEEVNAGLRSSFEKQDQLNWCNELVQ